MTSIGLRSCDCCGSVIDDGRKVIEIDGLTLNREFEGAAFKGERIELSQQQFQVLELLVMRAGKMVPRTAFFISIFNEEVNDRQLDVVICRIRHLFKQVDPTFDRIFTSRGRGYAWLLRDQERLAA